MRKLALLVVLLCAVALAQTQVVGVGVQIERMQDGSVRITMVVPGTSAARAGIQAQDELVAVGGQSVRNIDNQTLPGMLKGPAGSSVTLTVRSPGAAPRQLTLTRTAFTAPNGPPPVQTQPGLQQGPPPGGGLQQGPPPGGQTQMPPSAAGQPGGALRQGVPPGGQAQQGYPQQGYPQGQQQGYPQGQQGYPQGQQGYPRGQVAAGAGSTAMHFRRVGVRDPAMNNIEAYTLLVPAGWKVEGGIKWFPDYMVAANCLIRVSDPRTGASIESLPRQNFTWWPHPVLPLTPGQNYMGAIVWQPEGDVQKFIQGFYMPQTLSHLRNAQVAGVQDMPGIAQVIATAYGAGSQARAQRVLYEYQYQGQPWQEIVFVSLVYTSNPQATMWNVVGAYSMRAPKAVFEQEQPLMAVAANTMSITPEWYGGLCYVQKLMLDRQGQAIKAAGELSNIIARNSDQIRQMYSESYRNSSAVQDRINQNFSNYIRGEDTYQDPVQGRPVQLPSGYRDAYVSAQGEYVLTNDGLNPNESNGQSWQRMNRY